MATYLASFSNQTEEEATLQQTTALAATKAAEATAARIAPVGARLFDGACSACHTETSPLGSLTFNSNLHADRPDNVLLTMMHGTEAPALLAQKAGSDAAEIMSMPAYGDSLSDRQLSDLATYLRARFAPDRAAWHGLGAAIERARAARPMD
jgi:nicotinate dehydrogenase subunit B